MTFSIGISRIASSKDFSKSSFPSFANTLLNTISDVKGSFFVSFSIIIPPLYYIKFFWTLQYLAVYFYYKLLFLKNKPPFV